MFDYNGCHHAFLFFVISGLLKAAYYVHSHFVHMSVSHFVTRSVCPYSCRVYNSNSFLCRVLIVDGYLHTLMTIGHNLHLSIFMVVMDTGYCFPCVMKIFFVFTS